MTGQAGTNHQVSLLIIVLLRLGFLFVANTDAFFYPGNQLLILIQNFQTLDTILDRTFNGNVNLWTFSLEW